MFGMNTDKHQRDQSVRKNNKMKIDLGIGIVRRTISSAQIATLYITVHQQHGNTQLYRQDCKNYTTYIILLTIKLKWSNRT